MQLPQYPRYETYKPSGVDWIGDVPEDWQVSPGRACLYENKDKNTGMQESTVLSLSYGNVIVKPEEKLTGLVPESFETYQIVEPGDIIIRGTDLQNDVTSLRTGLAKDKGIITSAYINLRPHDNVLPFYLHYVLHSYDVKKVFYGLGSGLRQNLSYEDFKYLDLPLPDITTQERIVAFLDDKANKIDRAVKIKEGQIALLRERKQIIIQEAVTKGLNPAAPMKESGIDWIGQIPAHWTVDTLGSLLFPVSEKNHPDKTLLSVTREQGVIVRDVEDQESNHNFIPDDLSGYKLVRAGQFAMNKMKAWQGSYGISEHTGIVSPAYFIFSMLKDFDGAFFNTAIRSKLYVTFFGQASDGVRIGQWDLNKTRMKAIPFIYPSVEEQKEIVKHIEFEKAKIDDAIELKERQIEALKEYKATLINAAVTGKIRVI